MLFSLAFAGRIVRVALPASRGLRSSWLSLLTITPSPLGLKPLFLGSWAMYAAHPDRPAHLLGSLDPSVGTAIAISLATLGTNDCLKGRYTGMGRRYLVPKRDEFA